jgi:hypothetical protein
MALAMSSLPVPLSPWMRTVEREGALADDVLEVVALLEGALELDVLFFGAGAGDGGAHVGEQLLVVPRLLDEVGGAGLDGLHGVLHRAVGGDHDDGELLVAVANLGEDLEPVHVGQGEVEQNEVEGLRGEGGESVGAALGAGDGVALELEQRLQRFADRGFVVDDQDGAGGGDGRIRRRSAR